MNEQLVTAVVYSYQASNMEVDDNYTHPWLTAKVTFNLQSKCKLTKEAYYDMITKSISEMLSCMLCMQRSPEVEELVQQEQK